MWYALAADAIALVHALFVLFALFGSLLVLRWPRAVWLHVPAVLWGLIVEFSGATCPLTPLESRFRGELSDSQDFLSRWLLTVLYPESLTRGLHIDLGASLLLLNLSLYAWVWRKSRQRGYGHDGRSSGG